MTKIVYNACYGGFGLSHEAIMRYAEIKGITLYTNKQRDFAHYYLCPLDEWERIYAEDEAQPEGPGRFKRSNALYFSGSAIERNDPVLAQVVEELGEKASGRYGALRIVEIPAGTLYRIVERGGFESVETEDSYEWQVA